MSGGKVFNRQSDGVPPVSAPHIPVLLNEVVTALALQAGEVMSMALSGPVAIRVLYGSSRLRCHRY